MKRLFYPVLLVCISILTFNCQKEISGEGNPTLPVSPSAPITATISGRIVDDNNQPASGVSIKVGSKTATTNAKGYFRIIKASLDKNATVVIAEKTGYFKAYRTFQATSGANHVSIKLIKKILAGTINSSTGGEITLTNGSKIALPANGVVKATGSSYSGTINVYAAYIDPTAADILQTLPGSFMADDKNGKRVVLESFGMLAVELESAAGEKLQIASGKTATLTTAIPSSVLSAAPASIPLWYVDEQTGLWKEEGTAVKNGNTYVGEVKHFSFWNCDTGIIGINLSMTLKNQTGAPLVNIYIKLTRSNGNFTYGLTDSLGQVSGLVPINETLQMSILDGCYAPVFVQNIGPFTQNTNLGVITITTPLAGLLTIKGTVLNCSGGPVTNGYVIIDHDYPAYMSIINGQFNLVTYNCGYVSPTCDILAVDNDAQQQNTVTGIPVTSPVTNVGTIIACGTSTIQYINYVLDGTNYSLSSVASPADSFYSSSYTTQINPNYTTYFNGAGHSSNILLFFQSAATVAGVYPIDYLQVRTYLRTQLQTPTEVNVTSFPPTVGGFYEGNFSGSFKDSTDLSVTHTINGNFRLRRN